MDDKIRQCIKIAKMYYEEELGQKQIADELNISRPTVSRQLQFAKDQGFVQIIIDDPFERSENLAKKLQEKYGLKEVIIKEVVSDSYDVIQKAVAERAAEYLYENINDSDIVGISWGKTMYRTAKAMKQMNLSDVETVQLKGGVSFSNVKTNAHETLSLFAKSFNSNPRDLPVPVIFDSPEVKKLVSEDRHIKSILDLGTECDVAVYTVGSVRENALLFKLGFLSEEEKFRLRDNAIGDICSRFFDTEGKVADAQINERTMGVTLETLKSIPKSILVAGGRHKVEAIRGALIGKIPNVLITDSETANKLS